jgi:transcriptional regulator with XRE-family HTH domain
MNKLGQTIRLLRQERGLTQTEVAAALDMSTPAYCKIETGITDISFSRVEQIAAFFDKTAPDLLTCLVASPACDPTLTLLQAQSKLQERGNELMNLQRKVIALYERLNKNRMV